MQTETITIRGINYDVVRVDTPDTIRQRFPGYADHMERVGLAQRLLLTRPNGKVVFEVYRNQRGALGNVVKLATI